MMIPRAPDGKNIQFHPKYNPTSGKTLFRTPKNGVTYSERPTTSSTKDTIKKLKKMVKKATIPVLERYPK